MDNRPAPRFLHSLQTRYLQAPKKAKGVILDEFTQTTAYNRAYARRLLCDLYQFAAKPIRHPRARYYTEEDAAALEHLSELLDGMCSKLLKVEIPLVLP
jgi:hypothetical protein